MSQERPIRPNQVTMHSFWNKTAVDYLVEQSIDLQPGTYRFSLAMQGDETGASEDIFRLCEHRRRYFRKK